MSECEKQLEIKEFEKWSGKNCKNGNCPARFGHKISCTACEDLQENAWKAALEWVMDIRFRDTGTPAYILIIEELREE